MMGASRGVLEMGQGTLERGSLGIVITGPAR